MFNDAMLMHLNHTNHNASDRSTVYDIWLDHVQMSEEDFAAEFVKRRDKYEQYSNVDFDKLAEVTGDEVVEHPVKELVFYAEEHATRAFPMLEKRRVAAIDEGTVITENHGIRVKLLGTPGDQISEKEKIRRLQDISDRMVALMNQSRPPEALEKYFEDMNALRLEEQELDRRYPSLPPERDNDD